MIRSLKIGLPKRKIIFQPPFSKVSYVSFKQGTSKYHLSLEYISYLTPKSPSLPEVYIYIYGGFRKWWYPTTMVFPVKMIILGCLGVPSFKETPIYISSIQTSMLVPDDPVGDINQRPDVLSAATQKRTTW